MGVGVCGRMNFKAMYKARLTKCNVYSKQRFLMTKRFTDKNLGVTISFTFQFRFCLFIVLPTGKAPALEIDGTTYCESGAIAKYLAREFSKYY